AQEARAVATEVEQANSELADVKQEISKLDGQIQAQQSKEEKMKNELQQEQVRYQQELKDKAIREQQIEGLTTELAAKSKAASALEAQYIKLQRKARAAKRLLEKEKAKAKEQEKEAQDQLQREKAKAEAQAHEDAAELQRVQEMLQKEAKLAKESFAEEVKRVENKHLKEVKEQEQKIAHQVEIEKGQIMEKVSQLQRELAHEQKVGQDQAAEATKKEEALRAELRKTKEAAEEKAQSTKKHMADMQSSLDSQRKASAEKVQAANLNLQKVQEEVVEEEQALASKKAELRRIEKEAKSMEERADLAERQAQQKEAHLQAKIRAANLMERRGKTALQRQAEHQAAKLKKMIADEKSMEREQESTLPLPSNMSVAFQVPAMAEVLQQVLAQSASEACVFVFSGEGAHGADTDLSMLKFSPSWRAVQEALRDVKGRSDLEEEAFERWDPEVFLQENLGDHTAPNSPLVSVALNILHDLWQHWGQEPFLVVGHSVGEIAAAYTAGILTVGQAISIAHSLGAAMQSFPGEMVHTELRRASLAEFPKSGLHVAAINYVVAKGEEGEEQDLLSVTLCGASAEDYLALDPAAMKLRPCHAWHHPEAPVPGELPRGGAARIPFVSAISGAQLAELPEGHWQRWQRSPVKFAEALWAEIALQWIDRPECTAFRLKAEATFSDGLRYASSMRRGEHAAPFLRHQRAGLGPGFRRRLSRALRGFSFGGRELCHTTSFAAQGIASQQLVLLTEALKPFFPGLAAHDLYRFSSIEALLDWGVEAQSQAPSRPVPKMQEPTPELHFEILGCALRLPGGGADSPPPGSFWSMLLEDDQDSAFAAFKEGPKAAFLQPKFDRRAAMLAAEAAGVEGAEAAAMDPQHAFALQLAAEMWHDSGDAAEVAKAEPTSVGVYIGAWQPAVSDTRSSAYAAIGSSLSALAARVANAYNLQGPSMTVNTACSSALVAVHQALQEARTGQLAFAVVGGVNLFGEDAQLFKNLRRAGMLSPSGRCHTFSALADGYVRGEGGVLFLLHAGSGLPSRAQVLGSAVTQNSTQTKPLSSVEPRAQERVIRLACASARVAPGDLAALELHGTGTPLGDPVEISALARLGCAVTMTASKMHVGHLESAAGAVGLLKAMLVCENYRVPSFEVHGGLNPQVLAAMEESCLKSPGVEAELPACAYVGVSSFGFAGSNAHAVLTPTPTARACPKYEAAAREPVLLRRYSHSLVESLSSTSASAPSQEHAAASAASASRLCLFSVAEDAVDVAGDVADVVDVDICSLSVVGSAVLSIVGGDAEVDVDADLHELGIDSLGLAELMGLLEDRFGQGCLSIDKIMEEPTCRAIVKNLEEVGGVLSAKETLAPKPRASLPTTAHPPPPTAAVDSEPKVPTQEPKQVASEDLSKCWIRTTHVGSLPRPNHSKLDMEQVVAEQEMAAVDIINDGEWVRDNYIADVIVRIQGLSGDSTKDVKTSCCAKHSMPIAADMQDADSSTCMNLELPSR
ncbi:PKS40, partial [Symbiodinium necroappetens]